MQTTVSLNSLYADYRAGLLEKEKLEGVIFKAIHKIRIRESGFGKEEHEDFVSWLYPRIGRAIDTYRAKGASFETYMNTVVRMSAKEYRRKQLRNHNTESAAWVTQIPDIYSREREFGFCQYFEVAEARPAYARDIAQTKTDGSIKNTRQLLILILKCCRYVSDDFLERISPKLGMDPGDLMAMINRLKECRQKREVQVDILRELANRQLCRCLSHEKALRATKHNPLAAQRIKSRLESCREKLGKTRGRLARLYLDPSNAQVAEMLGLTKGSVDAVLYNLKAQHSARLPGDRHDKHILN